MTVRSGEDRDSAGQIRWLVGAVVLLGGLGALVDHLWGDPGSRIVIQRIPEFIWIGFSVLVLLACFATVAVGFPMTVFSAIRSAGKAIMRAAHSPRSDPSRSVAGSAAPVVAAQVAAPTIQVALPTPDEVDTPGLGADEYWTPTPVIGWRVWAWTGTELRGYRQLWMSSEFVAQCDTCSEVPGEDHPCGIYSVPEFRHLSAFSLPLGHPKVVFGKVELSGLVIEHERGYRAERARMAELFGRSSLIAAVSARYPDVHVTELPLGAPD